ARIPHISLHRSFLLPHTAKYTTEPVSAIICWESTSGARPMADEERRLVEVARHGDVESFNALVRLYEGRIYNLCHRMLGDADSAADAAQDAFLSAFRNLRSFRGGSFRSWILRIATNTCYDVLRARKRRPTTSLDIENDGGEDGSPLQIADPTES